MRRAMRVAMVTSLLAAAAASPAMAKLPDWADAIMASAPEVPGGYAEHRERVLLTDLRYAIQPDGSLAVRRRLAVQALHPITRWKFGAHAFASTAKVTSARAWHVPPGERARRSWSPAVDIAVGDSFLSDQKARVIPVEGVRTGSVLFFEFEERDTPYFLSLYHVFLEDGPIGIARLEVDAPSGWTLRWKWVRGDGPEPVVRETSRTWELRDLPYPYHEPMSPSRLDTAPLLAVQAVPGEGYTAAPATFADWTAASSWYERLIEGRGKATPAIRSLSSSTMEAAGPALLDQVKAAAVHVRDSVRYIAIELGIGGWQPHEAGVTLERLYGDCKDKGTLLRAMLDAAQIPSYPVLVNLTTADTISPEVPVLMFNHFVVAVPLPDDLEIPPSFLPAVADGGELGRLLIVDTTDDRLSIGSLSEGLTGKMALVVAGPHGRVVRLPSAPEAHRMERRIRVELKSNGSQAIARASRYVGAYASGARDDFQGSAADRERLVRHRVDAIWTGADVNSYAVETESDDGSFMETATLQLGPPPGVRDVWDLPLYPGALDDIPRVPLARRAGPVDYGHPLTVLYEVTMRRVPSASEIPEPLEITGDGWNVEASATRNGDAVVARWQATLRRTRFDPDDFAELRRFWSAIDTTSMMTLSIPLTDPSAASR